MWIGLLFSTAVYDHLFVEIVVMVILFRKSVRRYLFYLLDYVTPAEIFRSAITKKIIKIKIKIKEREREMVKYIVIYCNFPNLGNICK